MQIRKVKTSLRTKLLSNIIGIVLFSVAAYVFYALHSFNKDKTAYIFDTQLRATEALEIQLMNYINSAVRSSFLMGGIYSQDASNKDLLNNVFITDGTIFYYKIVEEQNPIPKIELLNEAFLTQNNLSEGQIKKIVGQEELPFARLKSKNLMLINSNNKTLPPHLTIYTYNSNQNEFYSFKIDLSKLANSFNATKSITNTLVDGEGKVIIHPKVDWIQSRQDLSKEHYVGKVLASAVASGTMQIASNHGPDLLVSYKRNSQFGFSIVSEISRKDAFAALEKLKKDSVIFAVLLICIAAYIGLYLSKGLTSSLVSLLKGTRQISAGDFKTKINVKAQDELGVLADSFNFMSQQILHYMGEVQVKARMENELAVAQLVQNSFFPRTDFEVGQFEVAGYYTPASECGGDWWGLKEINDKVIIFIGDATGHGVPAALITATANCCVNLLADIAAANPQLLDRPDKVMRLLNKVIHAVGGKILMTFFVIIIDKNSNEVLYSNASHNNPFLYKYSDDEPKKSDLEPLLESNGPRLGHKADAEYNIGKTTMNAGDVLLLATDGIIEGIDPDGTQWGERRFCKSMLAHIRLSARGIINNMLEDANGFFKGVPVDDDLTLVVVKMKS